MSTRPSNPPKIQQGDMLPGDVILSAGSSQGTGMDALLDKAILTVDQGSYTHASLWDGSHVIECLTTGVKIDDPLSMTLKNQVLIDVYRYSKNGQGFNSSNSPVAPLIDATRKFEGYGYGYSKLVLLGIMLLTSEIPDNRTIKIILQLLEIPALKEIEKWLGAEHSMICSELVAQGYWNAQTTPANKYGLPIVLDGHRTFPDLDNLKNANVTASAETSVAPEVTAFHKLRADLADLFDQHDAFVQTPPERPSVTLVAGSEALPATFVSPGDLQRCGDLHLVGTLKQPASG